MLDFYRMRGEQPQAYIKLVSRLMDDYLGYVLIFDREDRIVFMSSAVCRDLGCSREEMVRRSCEVGRIIQNTFQSWDELCQGFLDGFAAWRLSSGLVPEVAREYVQQRADIYWAIKGRKDSPYNLPWRMELDPGKK